MMRSCPDRGVLKSRENRTYHPASDSFSFASFSISAGSAFQCHVRDLPPSRSMII